MNKVIITGLALLSSGEPDECGVCNYDFSWIFNHPSVLLWADKIIVTKYIKSVINECKYPDSKTPLPKAIKMLFNILEDSNLLDTKNPDDVITGKGFEQICKQTEKDRIILAKEFSSIIKLGDDDKVPGQLLINKKMYCAPKIHSIYVALLLSRVWNASCLFDLTDYNYLRFRLGIKSIPKQDSKAYIRSFDSIFSSYLPNLDLVPHYAYGKECEDCLHKKKCADTYLDDLEKNTYEMLKWRGYEEIQQLKNIINKAIDKFDSSEEINPKEVKRELHAKEIKMNKLLHKTFPRVKRWSNLVTSLSIPFAVAGLASQDALLTLSGAAFAGSSKIVTELLKWMENKNRWVGFLNRKRIESEDLKKEITK